MSDRAFEDAFNLLCGDLLGRGIHRTVYTCRLRPDLVVKVDGDEQPNFANVFEQRFWDDHEAYSAVSRWLAPCEYLSPDGRILLQKRCDPVKTADLPDKLPGFITDMKAENFGMLGDRVVCLDYAYTIPNPSVRLKKAHWND